jgi:4-hydroxyphenylpyruvate dioxygenase-like putative hemolysin
MHIYGVDRVIIATRDLDNLSAHFNDLLGISFGQLSTPTTDTDAGSQDVENLLSEPGVELVAPRNEGDEVSRFIEENGPGLYAFSLRVADLATARDELAEQGVEPVGEFEQNQFRELFYHPRNFGGAFVILAEYEAPHPAETASSTDEA